MRNDDFLLLIVLIIGGFLFKKIPVVFSNFNFSFKWDIHYFFHTLI